MPEARAEELALLFHQARTHSAWLDRPVENATLRRLYELVSAGPTGANSHPLRITFVRSAEAKERLKPALRPLNVDKTMSAPITAIAAFDVAFYEKMPKLFPARPEMRDHLAALPLEERTRLALLTTTIQTGYLILAARALGLDCGPMGGFDSAKVDELFFPDGGCKSVLLVNLGYGDATKLFPRLPRLDFEEACRIL
ncbi:MAG: malonic semialdehyde reductase [Polyangiaceae bacterium]